MLLVAGLLLWGCGPPRAASLANDYSIAFDVAPSIPTVGLDSTLRVTLIDEQHGRPFEGASLQFEAHMSHPGMAPVIAPAVGQGRGVYAAHVSFPMAGDWAVVVSGELPDGRRVRHQATVPVRTPG